MKAIWNNKTLAESNNTIIIEGNHYFPADSIKTGYFKDSNTQSICPWKGTANYYSLEVDGKRNDDAAWYYPEASAEAKSIEGHIAFWKGVQIVE